VSRAFLQCDDLHDLVIEQFGSDRRLLTLDRLTGGTKKGVYRLTLDDRATAILYVWAASESYWPPAPMVPDDPFTDADGADLFAAAHKALVEASIPTPDVLLLDRGHRHLDADIALVEDAGSLRLESQMENDPVSAAITLTALGDALRRMHTTLGPRYGKIAAISDDPTPQTRPAQDVILERALTHLDAAAPRDSRLADAHHHIADHVRRLHAAVTPRRTYALVHGELGPDHVLVAATGEPRIIDIEGLAYFDIEWEHAWLQMRFDDAYPHLQPVQCDPDRLEFYRYAQVLSLIEGPLRIAGTDFPNRQWMLDLAEWNIIKALNTP